MRVLTLLLLTLSLSAFAQLNLDDQKDNERLKYGMSQSEWKQFQESGMSTAELEELISCGISFNEYNSRPWLSLGVAKKKWLDERCKGMGDEDIQSFNDKGSNDVSVIVAFVLPGSYHWRTQKYGPAIALSGIFAASVGAYFIFPNETEEISSNTGEKIHNKSGYPAFLVVALADMIMSSVFAYQAFNKPLVPETKNESEGQGTLRLDLRENRPTLNYVYKF